MPYRAGEREARAHRVTQPVRRAVSRGFERRDEIVDTRVEAVALRGRATRGAAMPRQVRRDRVAVMLKRPGETGHAAASAGVAVQQHQCWPTAAAFGSECAPAHHRGSWRNRDRTASFTAP